MLGVVPVAVTLAFGAAQASAAAAGAAPPPPALTDGSFTQDVGGRRLHYEVHGQGPVLMALTNSWGLSLAALRAMYRPLEERLTLVYFDPRGMGGSGPALGVEDRGMAAVRADFDALRAHLGLARVNAIGWSNGAMNLIELAAEHPATLEAAIFVHGLAYFGPEDAKAAVAARPRLFDAFAGFMKAVQAPGLADTQRTVLQREFWLGQYFPALFADEALGRRLVPEVFKDARLSWPHAARANEESASFDARGRLAAIQARCLVVAGAHDLAPPAKVKELADGLKDARFVVFAHSGHFSPVEEKEAFRRAIFQFLGVEASAR
jgi:pimeloyl-ACP methyl ester carboxylesterase